MVANLLHQAGLYLGSEADLVPPTPDNPEGHWENSRFTTINEQILREYQATWYSPPPADQDWNTQPIAEIRRRATALLEEFSGHEPWGWKDPRNCLTLPVWSSLLPDLKVVICLRNPLEAANSLRRRQVTWYWPESTFLDDLKRLRRVLTRRRYFSLPRCLDLWKIYNEHLLEYAPKQNRIVTHYESYFHDEGGELRRLLEFLNISVAEDVIEECLSVINKNLRHSSLSLQDSHQADVPPGLLALYLEMCEEAGVLGF